MHAIDVLLIEDNAGDAMLIRQALYDCRLPVRLHIARDGEQALFMLTDPPIQPDLIILDLNIPKITGTALLERWRVGLIPVVVLSSTTNPAEKARALALGAREFHSKPNDLDEFTNTVRMIVEKWTMPDASNFAN
jgi:CheY-like chemotaxis protein